MTLAERPGSRVSAVLRYAGVVLLWAGAAGLSLLSMFAVPRYAFYLVNSENQLRDRTQMHDPLLGLAVAIIGMFAVPVIAFVASRALTHFLLGRESHDEYGRAPG